MDLLRARTEELDTKINALRTDHRELIRGLRTDLFDASSAHRDATDRLQRELDRRKRLDDHIDAAGLPVVAASSPACPACRTPHWTPTGLMGHWWR